jgi:hypothetical protein
MSLRSELRSGAVQAAGLLQAQDTQIAQLVATSLVPAPFGTELTLLTDLIEAAGAQSIQVRNRYLAGAGIAAFTLVCLFVGRGQA